MNLDINKLYYLASPYSAQPNESPWIQANGRAVRAECVELVAAYLITKGLIVITPITMCHTMADKYKGQLKTGYDYWKTRDRKFVSLSDAVIVADMYGWKTSVGVQDEIEYGRSLGKKIYLLTQSNGKPVQELKDNTLETLVTMEDLLLNNNLLAIDITEK